MPAHRVVERCPCEEDDAPDSARKPVEYVRVEDWVAPPGVKRIEDRIEAHRGAPAGYVSLPRLTLHQGIPESGSTRLGYARYR